PYKLGLDLESIRPPARHLSRQKCRTAPGARVDHHVAGVRERLDQESEQWDALLCRVHFGRLGTPRIVDAVEDHTSVVTKLGQLVTVENKSVLAVADYPHVGFQDLGRVVLAEYEVDVFGESVALGQFDQHELLL